MLRRVLETACLLISLSAAAPALGRDEVEPAASTSVDPEKVATGATIADTLAETLPTTRIPVELSHLVPGVTGGHNMNVLGGTQYGNQYLLDGFDITDPVTNTVTANVNFDSIRAVEVAIPLLNPRRDATDDSIWFVCADNSIDSTSKIGLPPPN